MFAGHRMSFAIHKSCTFMQVDWVVALSGIFMSTLLHPLRFALRVVPCQTLSLASSVQVLSPKSARLVTPRLCCAPLSHFKNMATRRRGLGLGIFNERKKLQCHPDGCAPGLAMLKRQKAKSKRGSLFTLCEFVSPVVAFSRWHRRTGSGTAGRSRAAGRGRR